MRTVAEAPKLGLYLDMRNPPLWERPWMNFYPRWLEIIEEADRKGVGAVWIAEHHAFEDGYITQPLTLAAAIAARTTRLRIGTAVMLGALRNPRHIAEEATIVDLISSGRADIGIGVGYRPEEYSAFGENFVTRAAAVRRCVAETLELLAGDLRPPSVQRPIPLWGGFRGPRGARYAGELGIGLLDANEATWTAYRDGLRTAGHPPDRARLAHPANFLLSADPEAAWARIAPHYAYMWRSYVGDQDYLDPDAWVGRGQRGVEIASPTRTLAFQVVTPNEAEARLRKEFAGMPVKHVFCWTSIAGMDDDLVEEHIALLTGELTDRLSDWRPSEV